ncbi:MAG: dynamin family protein [Acidimicrobiales bacterium]
MSGDADADVHNWTRRPYHRGADSGPLKAFQGLQPAAEAVACVARGLNDAMADRAERLAGRLEHGRFHVMVVGEFNRGKSTLINALVGEPLLPSGALPVTSITTEVAYGRSGLTVTYKDGRVERVSGVGDLGRLVTEELNPGNILGIEAVEVRTGCPLLANGLVLVDTPGVNSIYAHNDRAARFTMDRADGAIVVISADAVLSMPEEGILVELLQRGVPCYVVVNKADHLEPGDSDVLRWFVHNSLQQRSQDIAGMWVVAARPALRAKLLGRQPGGDAGAFPAFEAELVHFANDHLAAARDDAARRELARICDEVTTTLQVASAALDVDADQLAAKVAAFGVAAAEQRHALADEAALLRRDVGVLARRLEANLAGFARHAPERSQTTLEEVAATAPRSELEAQLWAAISKSVEQDFESFRRQEEAFADEMWRHAAAHARGRVRSHLNYLRSTAAELFALELPAVELPAVADEDGRFFYLFLQVGSSTEHWARLARGLLPARVLRRRLLARSRRQLVDEFDKHAGRAHHDLTSRLERVRSRFEAAMTAEVDATIASILEAAAHVQTLQKHNAADRVEHERRAAEATAVIDAARRLCGPAPAQ